VIPRLQRAAFALWRVPATKAAAKDPRLRHLLEKAQLPVLPEGFLALQWTATLLAAIVGFVLGGTDVLVAALRGAYATSSAAIATLFAGLAAGAVYSVFAIYPDWRVYRRKRGIEEHLSPAVNYLAAMAAAGVMPSVIFQDLARQGVYGEVSAEARWIARDMELFGADLVTALDHAMRRTPSPRLEELLQGARTTIVSGGDLRTYFVQKSETFSMEDRQRQRDFLEGLGILSESYVTVVIAAPLFLLVMLSVMMLFGNAPGTVLLFTFGLVFIGLPLSHLAFLAAVRSLGGS